MKNYKAVWHEDENVYEPEEITVIIPVWHSDENVYMPEEMTLTEYNSYLKGELI